jgi:hypothetical protein
MLCFFEFEKQELIPMSRCLSLFGAAFISLALLAAIPSQAGTDSSRFEADSNGIYRVDAGGKHRVYRANKEYSLSNDTLGVSPDKNWALIDYLPAHAGPGRVAEVRILVSLKQGKETTPEAFQTKYGVWLDEEAQWDDEKPATIVLGNGMRVSLK